MKAAAKATYGRKGEDVVKKNWAAIDEGAKQIVEVQVPESWKNCEDEGLDMVHVEEGKMCIRDRTLPAPDVFWKKQWKD